MKTQIEKAEVFRALHASGTFVIPNPWDKGSARLLEGLGFQALATTSAGYAFSLGQRDNSIDRDTMLEHIAVLSAATSLPLSCDLENGFGDAPETVAETIRLAAAAGAVGGSIEDASGDTSTPIYDLAAAVDRIAAAAAAARALPHPFVLTARAENFLFGRADLSDTILRLQAYQQAGADALYAPGLKSKEDIATVIRSVDRPVNVLAGLPDMRLGVSDLADLGVRRISVGSGLARVACDALLKAAQEIQERGSFDSIKDAVNFQDLSKLFPR